MRDAAGNACAAAVRAVARQNDAKAVHDARQALKRARALLRLLEEAGAAGAYPLRRRLAASARKLSPLRDAHIVARLAGRWEGKEEGAAAQALHRLAAARPAQPDGAWWREWRDEVAAVGRKIAGLKVGSFDATVMAAALRASAKRVRRRARQVKKDPTPERAHQWRKAVIALREQLPVVRPGATELHRRLHRLSQRLGKTTNATALLAALVRQIPGPAAAGIVRRIRRKQSRAIERGRRAWKKARKATRDEIRE